MSQPTPTETARDERIPCDSPAYETGLAAARDWLRARGIFAELGDRAKLIVPRPDGHQAYQVVFLWSGARPAKDEAEERGIAFARDTVLPFETSIASGADLHRRPDAALVGASPSTWRR